MTPASSPLTSTAAHAEMGDARRLASAGGGDGNVVFLSPALIRWYRPPGKTTPNQDALGHFPQALPVVFVTSVDFFAAAVHVDEHGGATVTWRANQDDVKLRKNAI